MMIINNKIAALIMIGGQSRRMGGGNKSFIKFNGKTIFDRVAENITPQIKKIIVNCNDERKELLKYNFTIIKDIKKGYLGPLAGIHSAMNWLNINDFNAEWLITLPGDTPFIPDDLISNFKKKMISDNKIILAQSGNKIHPVIGAWHLSLFKNLDNELNKGVRKILSWASLHKIDYVKYSINKFDPFFNINTKEDIKKALDIEKEFYK